MGLTPAQAAIIKATVPVLAEHGTTITTIFYQNLLRENPALQTVFNKAHQVNGHQPKALAMALYAYAANIDDLGVLSPALELICQKHASMYIQPEQYRAVGDYLLATMKDVLGDACTPEILDAWGAAYWQLADIMIKRESDLYTRAKGWTQWRDFRIARKDPESETITSFYLEPVDKKPLPPFEPGQFISIATDVPKLGYVQNRQYSLSDAPWPDYYRISVKRERGIDMSNPNAPALHPGYMSNLLHDHKQVGDIIQVSHPFGDFYLEAAKEADSDAPVVLVGAGVGVTCLTSILNSLTANRSNRPVSWIQGARTSREMAFRAHVKTIANARDNVRPTFFLSRTSSDDIEGKDYHYAGRVDLQKLDRNRDLHVNDSRTQYFVCGPDSFMADVEATLKSYNVSPASIHMELFGTGGVVRA